MLTKRNLVDLFIFDSERALTNNRMIYIYCSLCQFFSFRSKKLPLTKQHQNTNNLLELFYEIYPKINAYKENLEPYFKDWHLADVTQCDFHFLNDFFCKGQNQQYPPNVDFGNSAPQHFQQNIINNSNSLFSETYFNQTNDSTPYHFHEDNFDFLSSSDNEYCYGFMF